MKTLYGDGIHDDTDAIQSMLDTGESTVKLPAPKDKYLISKTLKIHSNQELLLDRYTVIKLMPNSDTHMIENANPKEGNTNISVAGGIWDFNNMEQAKNPIYDRSYRKYFDMHAAPNKERYFPDYFYFGIGMRFANIKNLHISDITLKNPTTYGVQIAFIEQFTIENIIFDYNRGNPQATNMDGIHLEGGCKFGLIRNLKGTCYDDLIALNADELCCGTIEDLCIDGLYADNCHSAVRLLSSSSPIRRISISNIFGTYYQYCIGFSKFHRMGDGNPGIFEDISIRNAFVSKAERYDWYCKNNSYIYPLFWFQKETISTNIIMENIHRTESITPVETIIIEKDAIVNNLYINNLIQKNLTQNVCPFIRCDGELKRFTLDNVIIDGKDFAD